MDDSRSEDEKILNERLRLLYEKAIRPCCVGKSKNETLEALLIRSKETFVRHIMSDLSISEDEKKKELLTRIFKKTQYSLGVTSLIECISPTILTGKQEWVYDKGFTSLCGFDIPVIEDLESYVNTKFVKKQPAARGKVVHHMIQKLLVLNYNCYSTSPVVSIPEASPKAEKIPATIGALIDELLAQGFNISATEYPVIFRRGPVLKPSKSACWRWMVGKIDAIAYHKKYGICLLDFKVTNAVAVRKKHALQLSLLALCLASLGVVVQSLFLVTINYEVKPYRCGVYLVNFDDTNVNLTVGSQNGLSKIFKEEEDLKTFKSLSSDLISKLSSGITRVTKSNLKEEDSMKNVIVSS